MSSTSHGKTIALIVPNRQDDKREAALKRLAALRGKMIVGDILEPLFLHIGHSEF